VGDMEDRIQAWWDEDARTYDRSPSHAASDPVEAAAWRSALLRYLPAVPAKVLDAGAGTGALSLLAADLGFRVTALDLSEGMLERLRTKAKDRELKIDVVNGPADRPPKGPFDAVMERHLLWTIPDPAGVLTAWRAAAPKGRLVLFEGVVPGGANARRVRSWLADAVRRAAKVPGDHHAEYDPDLIEAMPLARLSSPEPLVRAVRGAGWRRVRIERLTDVDWARHLAGAEAFARRLEGWTAYVLMADAV
jgi:SAM-dependent methyltransferase